MMKIFTQQITKTFKSFRQSGYCVLLKHNKFKESAANDVQPLYGSYSPKSSLKRLCCSLSC